VKWDFFTLIVLGRDDTPSSAWLAVNAGRTSMMTANSELAPPSELKIVLVLSPSHGNEDGDRR
jgi:hypothetical protein